jgi:hypothetical protein
MNYAAGTASFTVSCPNDGSSFAAYQVTWTRTPDEVALAAQPWVPGTVDPGWEYASGEEWGSGSPTVSLVGTRTAYYFTQLTLCGLTANATVCSSTADPATGTGGTAFAGLGGIELYSTMLTSDVFSS